MNSSGNHSSPPNPTPPTPTPPDPRSPRGEEGPRQHSFAAADVGGAVQPEELLASQLPETEWLAFCYLADELSAAERQAFEQRLESDPEAQQALLLQLELTEQIVSASQPVGAATTVSTQTRAAVSIPKVLDANGVDASRSDTNTTETTRVNASQWHARGSQSRGNSSPTPYRTYGLAFAASLLLAAMGWFVWQGQQHAERQLAAEWASRVTNNLAPEESQDPIETLDNAGDPMNDDELSALGLELLAWEREREATSEPTGDNIDANDDDWIFSAAMALEDEEFEWLQGTQP